MRVTVDIKLVPLGELTAKQRRAYDLLTALSAESKRVKMSLPAPLLGQIGEPRKKLGRASEKNRQRGRNTSYKAGVTEGT